MRPMCISLLPLELATRLHETLTDSFPLHHFTMVKQLTEKRRLHQNLPVGHMIIQMDFSQKYRVRTHTPGHPSCVFQR